MSISILEPIAIGLPSKNFSCNWFIYRWIAGIGGNIAYLNDVHLIKIALALAKFLNELHKIDTSEDLFPGPHNFYRGASPFIYGTQAGAAIFKLRNFIGVTAIT